MRQPPHTFRRNPLQSRQTGVKKHPVRPAETVFPFRRAWLLPVPAAAAPLDPDRAVRKWLHGEHTLDGDSCHFIVTETDKYIWYSRTGREQYFDLMADPHEQTDRLDDPSCRERIDLLRARLVKALSSREEGFVRNGRLITGKPVQTLLEHSLLRG